MTTQPNPFVGPRSFEPGEKLYGRDRELRALTALLIAERIVLLHSPSGAGKTSLLKAGLLPKLREQDFNVLPIVRVNLEKPAEAASANRYVLSTMLSLEEGFPQAERLPIAELSALSLNDYLDKRAPAKDTLLVFDQFEEVITMSAADQEGKLAFFNQLGDALRNKARWALFSMREDYLGKLAPYLRPIPNRMVTRLRLDLLSAEAAIQAMQMPAKATGVNFTPEAAQQLADDLRSIQVLQPDGTLEKQLGPYVEPVQLQVVCYRLWESLGQDKLEIDAQDLANVGDVNEALANYYAMSVSKTAELSGTPERSIREWFDRKLITPDRLRGQVRLGTETSDGLPNADVHMLENAHLIRAEQRAGQTWMELSHDRLLEPVRRNNHKWFVKHLSLFQRQSELWLEKGRSEGLLLSGHDLEQAEKEIVDIVLTDDENAFLAACRLMRRRAHREQLLRRGILAAMITSTALFVVAVYFGISAIRANRTIMLSIKTAEAASTQAIMEQGNAQAASTQAIMERANAQAAATQAISQKAIAQAASTLAIANADAAATAVAQAEVEKSRAQEQELIAQEQKLQAQASALVAQSLLQQLKLKDDLSNLLAVEAFRIYDTTRTRIQMLATVYSRGRIALAQTSSVGIMPGLGFTAGTSAGLAASNFSDCEKNNYFLCDSGYIKLWTIQSTARANNSPTVSLRLDTKTIKPSGLDAIAIRPDGLALASASCTPASQKPKICSKESIQIWDLKTQLALAPALTYTGEIAGDKNVLLAYSPDGKTLALALNLPTIFNSSSSPQPTIILWNLRTSKQIGQVTPEQGLAQMAFSPDSKTLALASSRAVILLDLASMQSSDLAYSNGPGLLLSLAYSPDGKILAAGADDGRITLLDLEKHLAIEQAMTNPSKISALAFSPDGKILAAGYHDAGIILWDLASRQKLISQVIYKHVETSDSFPIYNLAFSPDGKYLASSSNEVILWDMDPASWANKACLIAGRNFTKAEWLQFFADEPYRSTCPQFQAGQ